MTNIWLTLLIVVPLVVSPFIYLVEHLIKKSKPVSWLCCTVLLLVLTIEWILFVLTIHDFNTLGTLTTSFQAITLRIDALSLLLIMLILVLGTLVTLFSGPYMQQEDQQDKYYAALTVMIGTMLGLVCTTDLFNLWLWFEGMTIASYFLVAFYRDESATLEACMKYLVQSAIGSVLILVGIVLILIQAGTLDLQAIRLTLNPSSLTLAAGALFIIGFGVKAAFVPMHTWLPDAHSQAPSGISAMLSGVVIEAALVAMLRVLSVLVWASFSWGILLIVFGALNMTVGNLLALRQRTVKRMLAYSSLGHVGYILLGIGISFHTGQITSLQGGFFHLFNHGLMKGLAFLSVGALLYALHLSREDRSALTIAELSGTAQRYPFVAFALSLSLLGLGGLPPLAGFMSKWQILIGGIETNDVLISSVVIYAAFNSVLSLVYYVPLINMLYRQKISPTVQDGNPVSLAMRAPLGVLSIAVVVLGIWPGLLDWLTGSAAATLIQAVGR